MSKLMAYDIQWDVDSPEDLAALPGEILLPEGMTEEEASDYISDQTGFCHKGFRLKKAPVCRCGCGRFYAHQVCHMDIIVDADNCFIENASEDAAAAIYDAQTPYGPYVCVECGAEYDDLEDLPDKTEKDFCCEEGFWGMYTLLRGMYNAIVSKKEYPDFCCWLADMVKSGVFVRKEAD